MESVDTDAGRHGIRCRCTSRHPPPDTVPASDTWRRPKWSPDRPSEADPTKEPVPSEDDQSKASKRVRSEHKADFAKAKTADQKVALAKSLLAEGREIGGRPRRPIRIADGGHRSGRRRRRFPIGRRWLERLGRAFPSRRFGRPVESAREIVQDQTGGGTSRPLCSNSSTTRSSRIDTTWPAVR